MPLDLQTLWNSLSVGQGILVFGQGPIDHKAKMH